MAPKISKVPSLTIYHLEHGIIWTIGKHEECKRFSTFNWGNSFHLEYNKLCNSGSLMDGMAIKTITFSLSKRPKKVFKITTGRTQNRSVKVFNSYWKLFGWLGFKNSVSIILALPKLYVSYLWDSTTVH